MEGRQAPLDRASVPGVRAATTPFPPERQAHPQRIEKRRSCHTGPRGTGDDIRGATRPVRDTHWVSSQSAATSRPPNGDSPSPAAPAPLVRCGDAFELIDTVPANSLDLLITSPPYWGLRTYGHPQNPELLDEWTAVSDDPASAPPWAWYQEHGGQLGQEPFPEWYVQHLVEFFTAARSCLKPDGNLWLNIGDTYFARWSSLREDGRQGLGRSTRARRKTPSGGWRQDKQLLLIPSRVAFALQDSGWILRNDLIWSKPTVAPRPERDRLRLSHEHLFHFVRRPRQGRASYYYDLSKAEEAGLDVVSVPPRRGNSGHSATFPPELVRPRILSSCPPGGMVLDPFCGTGTTLAVAVTSGRRAQGFELSPHFAQVARTQVRRQRDTPDQPYASGKLLT